MPRYSWRARGAFSCATSEMIQSASSDKLLNLVVDIDTTFGVVAMLLVVETILSYMRLSS